MSLRRFRILGLLFLIGHAASAAAPVIDDHCGESEDDRPKSRDFLKKAAALNKALEGWSASAPTPKALDDFRKKNGLPTLLWISHKSLKRMATQGLVQESPGGNSLLSFQRSIPAASKKATLRSDTVMELSEDGKVLRRWPFEADRQPDGVTGNELVFKRSLASLCLSDGSSKIEVPVAFAVKTNGSVYAVDASTAQGFEKMDCPEGLAPGLKAQSLVCRRYKDSDDKPRIVAVLPPIT